MLSYFLADTKRFYYVTISALQSFYGAVKPSRSSIKIIDPSRLFAVVLNSGGYISQSKHYPVSD